MFTTIVTDCKGENETGRQISRFNSLGLGPTNLIGVDSGLSANATIEAAGNLIDVLDATEGKKGVIVVNVAPRGNKKDGENGTRFCYFYYKKTLVIATIGGYTLSFVKSFGITKKINLVDTKEVLSLAISKKLISNDLAEYIARSQFRSFDFAPRLAKWLIDEIKIPSKDSSLNPYSSVPNCIWHTDSFGNAKTTILTQDIKLKTIDKVKTNIGTFKFYERLKDIPDGETAIYTGSSGLGDKRFLEIATQNREGSAAKTLNLKVGKEIKFM